MATLTRKANVIHDFQMPLSLSPFLQCLREQLSLGTHTAPGGEAASTGQAPAATPRQSLAEAVGRQLLLEPPQSFPAGGLTSSLTVHLKEPGQPLRNEVCLWGDLMDPVVCWVS